MKKKILILLILVIFILLTSESRGMERKNNIIETVDQVQVLAEPLAEPAIKKDTNITVQTLKNTKLLKIENYFKGKNHGDFSNIAKTIQQSCQKYNMPFEIILAIAILESGYGTSDIAKEKQNFFAIGAYDWNPLELASDFSNLSLGEAVDCQILILKNDYFSKYNNLEEIAKHYCKNWKHWLEEIQQISQEIKIQIGGGVK